MARTSEKLTQKKLNELRKHMNESAKNYADTLTALETPAVKENESIEKLLKASAEKFKTDSEYLAAKIVRKLIGELSSVDSVNKFIDANINNLPVA